MSLLIGLSYQDRFVIAANDSKVTVQSHDDNLEKLDVPLEDAGFQEEKIKKLTDKVLFCGSGILDSVKLVEGELFQRVKPSDDLRKCEETLKEVIEELKSGDISIFNTSKKHAVQFLDTTYVTFELLGFTDEGVTGLVRSDPETILNKTLSPMNGTYPIFIDSPDTKEDVEFHQYLSLPREEQTLENFVNRFVFIHAHLSHKHSVSVSSDCNFHFLFKVDDEYKYAKKTVDTAQYYDELGLS